MSNIHAVRFLDHVVDTRPSAIVKVLFNCVVCSPQPITHINPAVWGFAHICKGLRPSSVHPVQFITHNHVMHVVNAAFNYCKSSTTVSKVDVYHNV